MSAITFTPVYMERVWGGRQLETIYSRPLPKADTPYGESWEISDRPEAQSIVNGGKFVGMSLNELWTEKREEVFGNGFENTTNFPLLAKILDARADLSIQVHPPEHLTNELGGEAKTEMWYIADAEPGAKLYVGLKEGVTKENFLEAIHNGTVDEKLHVITPQAGESILIPSGKLHSTGAGLLIYEMQQSSDTTYRVFDWNRLDINGQPRDLHVEESMKCIDFTDFTPSMDHPNGETLAHCPYFKVDQLKLNKHSSVGNPDPERFSIITVVKGCLLSDNGKNHQPGDFIILPRGATPLTAESDSLILQTTIPR